MKNETTTTKTGSWRGTIAQAAKNAREYAKRTAEYYAEEHANADEANANALQDAAESAENAFAHAKEWYAISRELAEAAADETPAAGGETESQKEWRKAKDAKRAAERVRDAITEANADAKDWGCPIEDDLRKAAQEAVAEASAGTPGINGNPYAVAAAAAITQAWADAAQWG